VKLSPGREGLRELALWACWDVRRGDVDTSVRLIAELYELSERLKAAQLAELGYLPETVEGMTAVLHVAARIIDLVGDLDLRGVGDDVP
jgi:hypothetical protein